MNEDQIQPWEVDALVAVYGFACLLLVTFLHWFRRQLEQAREERDDD